MRPSYTFLAILERFLVSVSGDNIFLNTPNIEHYANTTTDPPGVNNTTTDFCKIFQNKKTITPQEAQEKVGPWFRDEFKKWESEKEKEPRFWTWYYNRYFPGTANSMIDCKLDDKCSPVHCSDVSGNYSVEVQENAFFAAESVANFHNTMWKIRRANTEKHESVMDDMSSLLSTFSDGANVVRMQAKHSEHVKLWMHAIIAVTVVASSGLSLVSSGLALDVAISTKLAMNAGRTAAKSSGLLRESLNFPSNILKGINTVEAGAASYITDIMTSSDYASGIQVAVKHIMTQNQDMTTKLFDANMLDVLNGAEGMIANMTIVDVVQSGLYANTTSLTPEFETQLRYLWTASAIGTMWSTESTYIVAADVSDGGCKADSRGHPSLKACLDEYPDKVFYTFFKTMAREGIFGRALMRGPPGHKLLKEATNFTITDVVRSSMTTFEQFQNRDSGSLTGVSGFQTLFGNASAMGNGGGPARGLFNLPICYTPGGEAITSINTKEGLNYPCMCSAFNTRSRDQPDEPTDDGDQEEPWDDWEQQSPNALSKRESSDGTWTGDINASHDFLVASGMYSSGDFRQFCQRKKKSWRIWQRHGNKCKIDKSQTWSLPQNATTGEDEPDGEDEDDGGRVRRDVENVNEAIAGQKNKAGIFDLFKEIWHKVKDIVRGPIEIVEEIISPGTHEGKNAALHPFMNCVSNPHTVVGCEEPNNDGYHENKGCGSDGGGGMRRSR